MISSDGFIAFGAYNGSSDLPPGLSQRRYAQSDRHDRHHDRRRRGWRRDHSGGVTNVSGGSVNTSGQDAHALFVDRRRLDRQSQRRRGFTTQGAGAIGIYAALGGVVSATRRSMTDSPPRAAFRRRPVSAPMASTPTARARRSRSERRRSRPPAPARTALLRQRRRGSGAAGSITATGTLNVKTTNASAAAVGLAGQWRDHARDRRRHDRLGGQRDRLHGRDEPDATFDNFTINNLSGDLVFADPSTVTLNFNNTTANAGATTFSTRRRQRRHLQREAPRR